jgi:flagellar biosynthesis/type III secretory pathway M-ring protein FliF/YscJ
MNTLHEINKQFDKDYNKILLYESNIYFYKIVNILTIILVILIVLFICYFPISKHFTKHNFS